MNGRLSHTGWYTLDDAGTWAARAGPPCKRKGERLRSLTRPRGQAGAGPRLRASRDGAGARRTNIKADSTYDSLTVDRGAVPQVAPAMTFFKARVRPASGYSRVTRSQWLASSPVTFDCHSRFMDSDAWFRASVVAIGTLTVVLTVAALFL